jgi:hypothetical protein
MYYDPATGQYDLPTPYTGTGGTVPSAQVPGGPPFSNNAAWNDWVIQELQARNPSVDAGALVDALGLYLNGQPVSTSQRTLVFDATAIGGNPPVAGPNGFPPKVQITGSGGGSGGGTPVIVPSVVHDRVADANTKLKAAGLKSSVPPRKPNTGYTVTRQSPAAGRRVAEGSTVRLTVKADSAPARKK